MYAVYVHPWESKTQCWSIIFSNWLQFLNNRSYQINVNTNRVTPIKYIHKTGLSRLPMIFVFVDANMSSTCSIKTMLAAANNGAHDRKTGFCFFDMIIKYMVVLIFDNPSILQTSVKSMLKSRVQKSYIYYIYIYIFCFKTQTCNSKRSVTKPYISCLFGSDMQYTKNQYKRFL